jgi:enoyl-CoA hydratase/carnithine racemase
MPEVKLGIPSVVEAALLPMLIGWGRTREILLLGENFTAQEALEWRLIERIAPSSELDAAVDDWIEKILTSSPRAVRLQKALIRAWEDLPVGAAVAAGIDTFAAAFETTEPATAMSEFIAQQKKRKRETRK